MDLINKEKEEIKEKITNSKEAGVKLNCCIYIQRERIFDKIVDDLVFLINQLLTKAETYIILNHIGYINESLLPLI